MTEFEKELVRFVSGYLDAGVSAEDYVKAFSQRLLDSIGRQSKPNGLSDEDEKTRKELIGQVIYIIPDNSECDNEGNVLPDYEKRIDKYIDFLKRISKPKVCEGLEEEIYNYANTIAEGTPLFEIIPQTARHFAKWGAEHAKECDECPSRGNTHSYLKGLEDGKKEMKEQDEKELSEKIAAAYQLGLADKEKMMMKDAVEGIAVINANAKEDGFGYVRSDYIHDDILRGLGRFKIIIVKED